MEPMCGITGAGQESDDARRIRLERRIEQQRIARMEREQRKRDEAAMLLEEVGLMASMFEAQGFLNVPSSSEAILALPVPVVGETAEQGCSVCYQLFEKGDRLRTMPCSHTFHPKLHL
ncbi:hypothetical protein PR202_gb16456 [Eleusine coracana subsp. coracana]|uniref:RING-type domain-containing protein n=1 Tax=Eleusine coracana subsp. coracana TaxID=191504 RepID=A0AAV5F0I2_ELECO|nr:hypothetical protein PR202_gb16456 [Eleusine coracana subsp. coracana]